MCEDGTTNVYFITTVSTGWHTHEICSHIDSVFAQQNISVKTRILQQFSNLTEIAITDTDTNGFVQKFERIAVVSIPFSSEEMNEAEKRDLKIKRIRDLFGQCKYVSTSSPIVFFDFTR